MLTLKVLVHALANRTSAFAAFVAGALILSSPAARAQGFSTPGPATAVPASATLCAYRGVTCNLPANYTGNVYYGAYRQFLVARPLSPMSSFNCAAQTFGATDVTSKRTYCYFDLPAGATAPRPSVTLPNRPRVIVGGRPSTAYLCAGDGGVCQVRSDFAGGTLFLGGFTTGQEFWAVIKLVTPLPGPITCSDAAFNIIDPMPSDLPRNCYLQTGAGGATYTTADQWGPVAAPPAAAQTVAALPSGVIGCADDSGTCNLPSDYGTKKVYYGAGSSFAVLTVSPRANFRCHPETFSIPDPVPNVKKTCYLEAPVPPKLGRVAALPAGAVACADDFGYCAIPADYARYSTQIYYGAGSTFEVLTPPSISPFQCHPRTWGIADPVPTVKKACYLAARPTENGVLHGLPANVSLCANEGSTCTTPKGWNGVVYFGPGQVVESRSGQPSVERYLNARVGTPGPEKTFVCAASTWNIMDPAPGHQKRCFLTR